MKKFITGAISALLVVCLMAPTGGLPSKPKFQTVQVRSATTPQLIVDDAAGNGTAQINLRDNTTQRAVVCLENGTNTCTSASNADDLVLSAFTNNASVRMVSSGTGLLLNNGLNVGGQFNGCGGTACNASAIRIGDTFYISKGNATSVANDATVNVDPDLQFTNVPVGNYVLHIIIGGGVGGGMPLPGAGGGIKWRVTANGNNNTGMLTQACDTTFAVVRSLALNDTTCNGVSGFILNGETSLSNTSSGVISFDWAQGTSNATNTTMGAGDGQLWLTRIP